MTHFALMLAFAIMPVDTLDLVDCQSAAAAAFPLQEQSLIAERIAALEHTTIDARFRPSLTVDGQGVYHSAVPELPLDISAIPSIPHDHYRAAVHINQLVYDGGVGPVRRSLATAESAATRAEVDVGLYDLEERVNDVYFAALMQDASVAILMLMREEVETRRDALQAQVAEGIASAGAVDVLEVELLRLDQQIVESQRGRRGALAALEVLTGLTIGEEVVLRVPVVDAESTLQSVSRPQYAVFDARREHLALQREMLTRRRRPTVSGIGMAGFGRPAGMDIFETTMSPFYSVGIRVSWSGLDWGLADRERAKLALRQEAVDAQEAAFTQGVRAAADQIWEDVERLQELINRDAQISVLRGRIAARAAGELENGAISATDYVLEQQALQRAELERERHQVELSYTMVRYLTLLGRTEYE